MLTVFLMLLKISLHLAEHARYLWVTWKHLMSAMALRHSAGVYGSTGKDAGACCDWRFIVLGAGLESWNEAKWVLSLAFRLWAGDDGILLLAGSMKLVRGPKLAAAGINIRGIRPAGIVYEKYGR